MPDEALLRQVKAIVALGKGGNWTGMYDGYRALFEDATFAAYRTEDQRPVLKLMIMQKGTPSPPSPAMIAAHRAALGPLTEMVSNLGQPGDHELLGMCHVTLGNEESATAIFKSGLALERERDPSSDLCGSLLKRVSML